MNILIQLMMKMNHIRLRSLKTGIQFFKDLLMRKQNNKKLKLYYPEAALLCFRSQVQMPLLWFLKVTGGGVLCFRYLLHLNPFPLQVMLHLSALPHLPRKFRLRLVFLFQDQE